jgi:formylglycine-generating enzyme required for sulfatase activity
MTGIAADGMVTWTNATTNATFTVQRAAVLSGATSWNDYVQVPVTEAVTRHWLFDPTPPAGMVLIPAGSFTMGNCMDAAEGNSDELPTHTVFVSAFYMGRHEVTKALWDDVYQWAIAQGYSFDNAGLGKAANHPVHTVNWYDVVKWCNARSQREGKTPAYYTDAEMTVIYKTGQVAPYVRWDRGYRLPTEAEWEKAARGGVAGHRFPWSDTDNITHGRANYNSSTSYAYDTSSTRGYHPTYNDGTMPYTSPVGSFAANGYGLYDMAGNVWEWSWDRYGAYGSVAQSDPQGPASGSDRVTRGGGWGLYARGSRSAYRYGSLPSLKYSGTGFRPVLPPGQ